MQVLKLTYHQTLGKGGGKDIDNEKKRCPWRLRFSIVKAQAEVLKDTPQHWYPA